MSTPKPPYGHACNRCGLCCQYEVCPLGQLVFRQVAGPCPALERDGEQFACGLVAHPSSYAPIRTSVHGAQVMSEAAAWAVGAGVGCDARVETDDEPPREYADRLRELAKPNRPERRRAERLWRDAR